MARIALFDGRPGVKCAEFDALPLRDQSQYRCVPPDALAWEQAKQVSQEVSEGRVNGRIDRFRWCCVSRP